MGHWLLSAATGLSDKARGFGKTLQQGLGMLTPLLNSQGIKVPDVAGVSSPQSAGDLVDLLAKYEPAMKMLQNLAPGSPT